MRIIWTSKDETYRIVEHADLDFSFDDLCGDCFDFERSGYTGTREELAKELEDFKDLVNREGVYGYVLEHWNPKPNQGWEHIDSCWGFVGQYSPSEPTFNHYIVEEMIETARRQGAA